MIIVDTSVLIAILLRETEAEKITLAIENDEEPLLSVASFVELGLVMKYKQGPATQKLINSLITIARIAIVPVTKEQAYIAQEAIYKFPILNYGDVFSYALAKERNAPLLFKGNDFSQTDVKIATY